MKNYIHTGILRTAVLLLLITFTSCKGQSQKSPKGKNHAAATTAGSAISVSESNVQFAISDHFNGFNAQMMRGPSWHQEGFAEKVASLNPKLIRYPGGTVASYWDWKEGWLMNDGDIKKEWASIPRSPIKLQDLKFACDQTGAKPVFVLNMMKSTLAYQLEMLRSAAQTGLPVLYVELDNELYLGEKFYVQRFPTGADYAKEANTWISTIKKEFPGVKIAVVGYSNREGAAVKKEKPNAARTANWNRLVAQNIQGADGMTFHVYGGSGLKFLAKKVENATSDDDDDAVTGVESFQQAFDDKSAVAYLLGIPFSRWKNTVTYDYAVLPKGMKAWITEYNLFEKEGVVAGTWAHGLYAVSQTWLFLENPLTELICYHNLTTSAQFAAIFNNGQGLDKAVKKQATQPLALTASGHTLALSGQAMKDGGNAVKLQFSSNNSISAARGQQYDALTGWVVKGKSGKKILVTNLSAQSYKADFSKVISGSISWSQKSAPPQKQIAKDGDVNVSGGSGAMVTLAPYSVTLIEGN